MPPKSKTDEQRKKEKQEIIAATLDIINKHGLESLSMRKLGSVLNMSGANVYNYFYSKDELYLHILMSGFERLGARLREAVSGFIDPFEALENLLEEFFRFGMEYPSYYELMFSTRDPKSQDYVGTPVEQLAKDEKAVAVLSFEALEESVGKCLPGKAGDEISAAAALILCEMHGCINLYHTNVLKELDTSAEAMKDAAISNIISRLKS
ncbi:MAG: TetR/AcrR family transcriptional regulator [Oscillospiraceae bacterium]